MGNKLITGLIIVHSVDIRNIKSTIYNANQQNYNFEKKKTINTNRYNDNQKEGQLIQANKLVLLMNINGLFLPIKKKYLQVANKAKSNSILYFLLHNKTYIK